MINVRGKIVILNGISLGVGSINSVSPRENVNRKKLESIW
jgi:hypothetical protein